MTEEEKKKIIKDYKDKVKMSFIPSEMTIKDMMAFLEGWYEQEKINKMLEHGIYQKQLF